MKIFLVVVTALAFVGTTVMENKAIPSVVGLASVAILIRILTNEVALMKAEQDAKDKEEAEKEETEKEETEKEEKI